MKEVTFQKKNGNVIKRYMSGWLPYRIGYVNAYGWEVIDIKEFYHGKYYSLAEYDRLRHIEDVRSKIIREFKNYIFKGINELSRLFILLIFVKVAGAMVKI